MGKGRQPLGVGFILVALLAIDAVSGADPNAAPPGPRAGGRPNPFGSPLTAPQETGPVQQAAGESSPSGLGDFGPLSLDTVELKYLSAKGAAEAFKCLSSQTGKLLAQDGSNTLLIFDTPDALRRLVTEIKKADRPLQALTIKAFSPKYLDAKTTAGVLAKVGSGAGTMTIVERTNTIIVCDTRTAVEAMVTELAKVDVPTAGLMVEAVALQHIDAKSVQAALDKLRSEYGVLSVIERTNTLVVCDLEKNVNTILAELKKIDRPTAGLAVETVNLKFLQAKNLLPIVTRMLTQYGQASANEASNSVIICDTQDNLVRILDQVQKADQTPQQIMVEVVLLDVQLGNDTEIGVNWDYLVAQPDKVGYRQNFTQTGERLSMVPDTDTAGQAFNTVGTAGELSVVMGDVRNVVHMIQEKRDVQIIATPRAMMVSGQSAKIEAAQEIPYQELTQTSGGGNINSTQFKPVGVTLEVTATLTADGEIFLKVDTQQSVKTGVSVAGVPVVDKRSETTSLLLKDGQIVVMGGLRRQEKNKQVTHVPLVGDLPVVGNLFKSTTNSVTNAELVVLLSPHVYKGQAVPAEVMAKVNQAKEESVLTPPAEGESTQAAGPEPKSAQ